MSNLAQRVSFIVRANLNDMFGKMEKPEIMIPQAIREFKDDVRKATLELASTNGSIKIASAKVKELESKAATLWNAAAAQMQKKNEAEATKFLNARNTLLQQLQAAKDSLATLETTAASLNANLGLCQERLTQMETHKDALIAQAKAAKVQGKTMGGLAGTDSNSAWAVFTAAEEKIQAQVATTDALATMAGGGDASVTQALLAASVEDDLAKLRAAAGNS